MFNLRRRWGVQPQAPIRPAQRWLDRGLVYADTLTQTPFNAVTNVASTVTGTKLQNFPLAGQGRGFGSTLGVGSTDAIQTDLVTTSALRTYIVRVNRNGSGGGGFGRVFVTDDENFYYSPASSGWRYDRNFSTTDGSWVFPANSTGVGYVLAFSYDSGSTANNPACYVDGFPVTETEPVTPVGTATNTGSTALLIGNNSAGTRNFDGLIADVLIFNSILTAAEVAEITADMSVIWDEPLMQVGVDFPAYIKYVIGPVSGWTNPTSPEVLLGQLSGGGAATATGHEAAPLVTTNPFTFTDPATGLTANTPYNIAYVWTDGVDTTATPEIGTFTTLEYSYGTAAGVATATAVGKSTFRGVAASAGVATAAATGKSTFRAVGASAGAGAASATGKATTRAAGASAGVATASATGKSTFRGVGSATGVATAAAVGAGGTAGVGAAAGVATAAAVGRSTARAVGSAAGTATATAVGSGSGQSIGTAAGSSTATAVGRSTARAAGSAAGVATATAVGGGGMVGIGSAAGTSTATAAGRAIFRAAGSSSGAAAAAAVATARFRGIGLSESVATALGTAVARARAAGSAAGTSTAAAVSTEVAADFVAACGGTVYLTAELRYMLVPRDHHTMLVPADTSVSVLAP